MSIRIAAYSKDTRTLFTQFFLFCGFTDVRYTNELSELLLQRAPDTVVVLDRALIREDTEERRLLLHLFSRLPTLVTSNGVTDAEKYMLLRLGARGYLSIPAGISFLSKAIVEIANGGLWFERSVLVKAVPRPWCCCSESRADLFRATADMLTPREKVVAWHVSRGLRNREIAAELAISEKTVKLHLTRIYRKLDVSNRVLLGRLLSESRQA